MRLRLVSWPALLITGAASAECAAISTARPFTLTADVTAAVGIAGVVLGGAVSAHRGKTAPAPLGTSRSFSRPGAVAWVVLLAAFAAFELLNFFEAPRHQHPTISSLLGLLTGNGATRALLFAAWLVAGWWLWRRT